VILRRALRFNLLTLTLMVALAVVTWPTLRAHQRPAPARVTLGAPARLTQSLQVTAPGSEDIAGSARRRLQTMSRQGYAAVTLSATTRPLRSGLTLTRIVWRGSANQVEQISASFRSELLLLDDARRAGYVVGPIVTTKDTAAWLAARSQ
jgi:hypothetical protein